MIWNRNKGDRNNGELIRRRIVFYGWVQGVGFRWRALQAANDLGVTGWVRNDPSGSVTMEAQGTQEAVDGVKHRARRKQSMVLSWLLGKAHI